MPEWFSFQAAQRHPPLRGAPAEEDVLKEDEGVPNQKAIDKSFLDKGTYELKISYKPTGMWHKEVTTKIGKKDSKVVELEMPESGVILEPGKPMLPVEGLFVALPPGAELVDIKVVSTEKIEYPGDLEIIPAPEPSRDGKGIEYDKKEPEFKQDKKVYGSDEEYPKELFKLIGVNFIGGVKVAHLMMYPLHYKPKSKSLVIYTDIELTAEYTPGITISSGMRGMIPEEGKEEEAFAPQIQAEFKSRVLNMDALQDSDLKRSGGTRRVARPPNRGKLCETSNRGQYLIICTKNLAKTLKKLADSKKDKGMTVKIVTDKEIYDEFQDSPEPEHKAIRDFILFAYDNWEDPPEYVLLVGEIKGIPTHHNETYNCPSDWYYSNLIGDIGPDIVLGRLAIKTVKGLKDYIQKVLDYEKADGKWTTRILLTAFERYDYMNCSDDIAEILKKAPKVKVSKRYGGQSTKKQVIDEIEDGCGIVNYRGHGSEWEWQSSNGLGVQDVGKLKNCGKWPVIFSICCLNSAIDVSTECFGEAFIEAEDGCVAFLGASRPSYTQPNHHFDRYIWRAIVDHGLRIVGKIFNFATIELFRNFPDYYTKENVAMYLLLGDPSLEIKFPS